MAANAQVPSLGIPPTDPDKVAAYLLQIKAILDFHGISGAAGAVPATDGRGNLNPLGGIPSPGPIGFGAAYPAKFTTIIGRIPLLHVREEQPSGTMGGTANSGAWRTRVLNTSKTNEISGASLASNQITLPAGTYWLEASAPAFASLQQKIKLYNVTDSTDVMAGTSEYAMNTSLSEVSTNSFLRGRFVLAGTKALELRHQVASTRGTNGFGYASAFGNVEVYSEVMIWQVG
jgi:hypothetical protein